MTCDDSNLSAYLDGELSGAERRAVEAHLKTCPDCVAALKDLERVRTMLLTQAIPMGLHVDVMKRIRKEETVNPPTLKRLWWAMAAAVLLAVAATVAYRMLSPGEPEPSKPQMAAPVTMDQKPEEAPQLAQVPQTTQIPPLEATPAATLAETDLPLTLSGTVTGDNPLAIIVTGDEGGQRIFRPGDTVLDGVVIREIQKARVILDNKGVRETLTKGPVLAVTPPRPSVDGVWQMAVLVDGQLGDHGPVVKMTEVDGTIRFTEPEEGLSFEGRLEGRTLIAHPTLAPVSGEMRGEFNETFTEVVFASSELSSALARLVGHESTDGHTYALKLTKISSDSQAFDTRAIMQARNDEVREMYIPLKVYAGRHQGQFPATLAQLVPEYAETLEVYADREDRIVSYSPGRELQDLSQLDPIPDCRNKPDAEQALLRHEAKLQQFWGGPAPFAPTLIEVSYREPDQVFTLNVQGGVSERSAQEDHDDSATEEARWQAMVASDQNNLKQLGLVNKMFQNENWGEHVIPGFCTVYPEYLSDPNVLTSPWDETGTVSYELLFPAAAQEDLVALGIDMLAAEGNADPNNPALDALAQSKIPIMFNAKDIPAVGNRPASRNVLFLDGHVQCLKLDEFQERVGPFLR